MIIDVKLPITSIKIKYKNMKTRKAGCLFSLIKLFVLTFLITGAIIYFSIFYIVPLAVSSTGKIIGIDMNLGSFSFGVIDQYVELEDFYIKNPDGYDKNGKVINLNKARIDMDSIFSNYLLNDLVVVDEILVDGFELSMESNSIVDLLSNNNNLTAILSKVQAESEATQAKDTASTDETKEIKVVVKKVVFKNGKIQAVVSGANLNIPMPDFEITNIGVSEGGVSSAKVSFIILGELVKQSLQSVAKTTGSTIGATGKAIGNGVSSGVKSIFDAF